MSEIVLQNEASPGALGANLVAIFIDANGVLSYVGNDAIVKQPLTSASFANVAYANQVNTFTKAQAVTPGTFANTGNTTLDANASNIFRPVGGQLTGNVGLPNPSNLRDGQTFTFFLQQGSGGNLTMTYGSLFKFATANERTLTAAASARDVVSCVYDATANLIFCGARQNVAS